MANFTIKPVVRDYVNKDGLSQVLIVVSYLSRKYRKPTSIKITAEQLKKGVIVDHPRARNLNAALQQDIADLELQLLELQRQGQLSPDSIKRVVNPKAPDNSLYGFIQSEIDRLRETFSPTTLRGWETQLRKLRKWHPEPIQFGGIDHDMLSDYAKWMRKQSNGDNTVWDSEKFLCNMFNRAIPRFLQKNPYEGFERVLYTEDIPRYLNQDEIDKLRALVAALGDGPLKTAGTYFMADLEMGLRVADLMKLDPETDFQDGRIIKKTNKAKTIVSLKTSEQLKTYLEYIKTHPLNMSPQLYDRNLKKLGVQAGIKTRLSSHVARHTLGRRLAKAKVNIKVAQKILGHKKIVSTERYYHIEDEDVDNAIDLIS